FAFYLKFSDFLITKGSAMTTFNELLLEGKLCDAIIKVNDVEFNVHRIILCGCSFYFCALFSSGWSDTKKQVYNIPGVSSEIMRLIIEYAYTCSVPVTEDNVECLLVAADQFNVMGIVRACCSFLENKLCVENCIGIYRFADFYCCWELRQRACLFILQHFEEVVRTSEEFLDLDVLQFCDIIEKDNLNIMQENVVFEAILQWIAHTPATRKHHISLLLPKVRLALMDINYFLYNVKNNEIVKDSEECKPIIINTLKAMYDLTLKDAANFQSPLTHPRLPNAILLAIGGWSGSSPTNGIEAYDARADCWVNVTVEEESPRAYHGTAYLNGFIYCIGGFDSMEYFSTVRKFNPVTRTWHQAAPMHSRRCYVSVAVLDGFIYAMGGYDGYVRLNTAERYEPETNQWTVISPMHQQRSDASATSLHGRVYICGGSNGNECLFTAECYSPDTNQWTLIAPMRSRRSGVGVIAYGEHIYAVGGFDGIDRLQNAEIYNPVTDSWHIMSVPMNSPRSNFGIEVMDGLLFVVGGFNGFATIFNVEYYNQKTNKWCEAHDMGIFRSALSCCVVPSLPNITDYTAPRHSPQSPQMELGQSVSKDIFSS
uniref:Kelch like family member 10 n=1 Tax=Scleropages formosus TaxID=113540 RepID=A0A8C9VRD3_SCLFO